MSATAYKLVTIVTVYEAASAVEEMLVKAGARGYTVVSGQGRGVHGKRRGGFLEAANQVFTAVTTEAVAAQILVEIENDISKTYPTIAYAVAVEAVPKSHFP